MHLRKLSNGPKPTCATKSKNEKRPTSVIKSKNGKRSSCVVLSTPPKNQLYFTAKKLRPYIDKNPQQWPVAAPALQIPVAFPVLDYSQNKRISPEITTQR